MGGAMKVSKIIKAFATRTHLAVDVNDVVKFLKDNGIKDEIEFFPVALDSDVLLGKVVHWVRRDGVYAEPIFCADIYFCKDEENDWRRLICCKELLHILDHDWAKARKPKEVRRLAEKIGLPRDMQQPLKDGVHVNTDRLAEYQAIAVLFPMAARDLLLQPLNAGQLTLNDIARLAEIPRRYAGFVMHEAWTAIYPLLIDD
jgi:hypothetical protein